MALVVALRLTVGAMRLNWSVEEPTPPGWEQLWQMASGDPFFYVGVAALLVFALALAILLARCICRRWPGKTA